MAAAQGGGEPRTSRASPSACELCRMACHSFSDELVLNVCCKSSMAFTPVAYAQTKPHMTKSAPPAVAIISHVRLRSVCARLGRVRVIDVVMKRNSASLKSSDEGCAKMMGQAHGKYCLLDKSPALMSSRTSSGMSFGYLSSRSSCSCRSSSGLTFVSSGVPPSLAPSPSLPLFVARSSSSAGLFVSSPPSAPSKFRGDEGWDTPMLCEMSTAASCSPALAGESGSLLTVTSAFGRAPLGDVSGENSNADDPVSDLTGLTEPEAPVLPSAGNGIALGEPSASAVALIPLEIAVGNRDAIGLFSWRRGVVTLAWHPRDLKFAKCT